MANDSWYSQLVGSWKLAGKIVKIEINKAMNPLLFHFEDGGVGQVEAFDLENGSAVVMGYISYANVKDESRRKK